MFQFETCYKVANSEKKSLLHQRLKVTLISRVLYLKMKKAGYRSKIAFFSLKSPFMAKKCLFSAAFRLIREIKSMQHFSKLYNSRI